ncbi:sensor histidine kinase [Marisediminicola senii]|uniref:sensor histidine kinase n=1 Tax=Marisediminicola senii TaxID=2711233 RepID=UPI0013EC6F77|nr:ATP-binding protein [Marisediminicola senii]
MQRAQADLASPVTSRLPRNPISRRQIETVVFRASAAFGLLFGAQAFPIMLEQNGVLTPPWTIAVNIAVFGGLIFAAVSSISKRWVRTASSYVVVSWFAAMGTWPIGAVEPFAPLADRPWPWMLCTVATTAAAVAFPVWASTLVLFAAPITFGVVRLMPAGGSGSVQQVSLDVLYAVILGGAVLVIITMLRQAAAAVDLAQSMALERYSTAVGQHATEVERVQVDSIVHDSVLTTLLSAARSPTPDAERMAARMAENAMGHLRDAATSSPDGAVMTPLTELVARIRRESRGVAAQFDVTAASVGDGQIPAQSAEAIAAAVTQSMVNSAQHAGTGAHIARWVSVGPAPAGGIVVEIGDTGIGFDVGAVPVGRIGLRVSIIERVANAGGRVEIDSHPGEGTVIRIAWPVTVTVTEEPADVTPSGADHRRRRAAIVDGAADPVVGSAL